MNKRIISLLLISTTLLVGCSEEETKTVKKEDVKNPFAVEYAGQVENGSVDEKTGEILYTPEYVLAYRFPKVEESELRHETRKLVKSKSNDVKRYGKSVMGTTYDFAQEVINSRGQDFSDYRITSEDTLENLAQISLTNDIFVFEFCGVKLEDSGIENVTVYYTMKQLAGDAYEENT